MQTDINSDSPQKPYFQAVQFYNEYENNKTKALEMISNAIRQADPNPPFYVVYYKAKIQRALGYIKGAIKTSEYSLKLSHKANAENYVILNNYLLQQLNKELKK